MESNARGPVAAPPQYAVLGQSKEKKSCCCISRDGIQDGYTLVWLIIILVTGVAQTVMAFFWVASVIETDGTALKLHPPEGGGLFVLPLQSDASVHNIFNVKLYDDNNLMAIAAIWGFAHLTLFIIYTVGSKCFSCAWIPKDPNVIEVPLYFAVSTALSIALFSLILGLRGIEVGDYYEHYSPFDYCRGDCEPPNGNSIHAPYCQAWGFLIVIGVMFANTFQWLFAGITAGGLIFNRHKNSESHDPNWKALNAIPRVRPVAGRRATLSGYNQE